MVSTNSLNSWITQFLAYLQNLPGGGNADVIEAAWRSHENHEQPVVTLYGSYDTGKSSLLKRLLVDDGHEVPDWLTVSARRETFDIHEVKAFNCLLRDTPGISGGNASHEAITQETLIFSDAFLVVLTPQLLTSDREQIVQFLTGKFFSNNLVKPFTLNSVQVVIARMDEAGTDPSEDEENYSDLLQRKQDELQQILVSNGIDIKPFLIHTVMADPYGQVGNVKQPSPSDYDELRHVDGIASLTNSLKSLPDFLPELRQRAAVRYFSHIGAKTLVVLENSKTVRETALEECRNWVERFALLEKELDALVDAATSDIEGVVEEVLTSVTRLGATTSGELIELIQPRLTAGLERWSQRHDVALNQLIEEAEVELQKRAVRPAAKKLFDLLGQQSDDEFVAWDRDRWTRGLRKLGNLLDQGLQAFYEIRLGMTVEQATLELEKMSKFNEARKFIKVLPGGKKLSEVEKMQQYIGVKRALGAVGPTLLEMGELVINHFQEQQISQQNAQRREELRERIAISAREIAKDALHEWKGRVDGFCNWLKGNQKGYLKRENILEEEVNLLVQKRIELEGILTNLHNQR